MIQILALRPYKTKDGKEQLRTKVISKTWHAESVAHLFAQIDHFIKEIPEAERWNLYYTVLDCKDHETEHRVFQSQKIVPFDIDKLDESRLDAYIKIFLEETELDREKTGIVFSGNGLQFLVELENAFTDPSFFNDNRMYYKALTDRIQKRLDSEGLPGVMDDSVWSLARLMRLPNTENRKKHGTKLARLIQGTVKPQAFNVVAASRIPQVAESEQISQETFKQYVVDSKAVMTGCQFLQWMASNPEKVTEPLWYAGISITSRLENGEAISHKISEGHPSYSHAECETKISQALKSSGPRTCSDINGRWGGCKTCPHFGKITSPILIRGDDFISTEKQGFYDIMNTPKGPKYTPNYDDLVKFFDREHHFKTVSGSQIVYVWNGTHYEIYHDNDLFNFAEKHFDPPPSHRVRMEFRNKVISNNLVKADFFTNFQGKINFKNGVLDIHSKKLEPHHPSIGFRYVLPYDYDIDAVAPRFGLFLKEVTGGDTALVNLLLEFGGYAISGDRCWAQKALILTGEGKNGKSVYLDILREIAGNDNHSSMNLSQVKNDNNRQLLEGKLFNISEETPGGALQESSLFKQLVTGGRISVKLMYKQPYFINNTCKIIFACNELPESKDQTYGLTRRMIIVPFNKKFEGASEDKFIMDKLKAELPGIFNMLLEGYLRLKENLRFTEAAATKEALEEYKQDIDPVLAWERSGNYIKVHPLNGKCHRVTYKELFDSMRQCVEIDYGIRNGAPTFRRFCKRLASIIPDLKDRSDFSWNTESQKSERVVFDVELLKQI